MLVLGIESSTPVATVALVSEQGLVGEMTLNIGLTHSEQLLPLIDQLMQQTRVPFSQVEGLAVAGGPGSFTGLRIGMATAKGLAQGRGIPLASVSTLLALAYNHAGHEGLVAPLLNARREEVYTALFRSTPAGLVRLESDQAISPAAWTDKLRSCQEPVLLVGDGAVVYQEVWQKGLGDSCIIPPAVNLLNRAATVAWLGRNRLLDGQAADLYDLKPVYIRPAEAQVKLNRGC